MTLPLAVAISLQLGAGPYADSATAVLIARARERHRQQDAAVHDYRAILRTRLDASLGRGGFARFLPIAVEEQESQLYWQAPNDVKLVTLGRRFRTAFRGADVNSSWTHPWFIPRFLGDSIRLLGGQDFPERAAIHPLAAGADAYYDYAIADSLTLFLPGRTVRAVGVRITPTRADASLIAGEMWLDASTAETVRLSFVFVGKRMWVDSIGPTRSDTARADRNDALAQRIVRVSADLEYGLYDERYWLPYRQAVTIDISLPWFKNIAIPAHFTTTFRAVRVNENAPLTFTALPRDTTHRTSRRRRGEVTRRCGQNVAMGRGLREQEDSVSLGCVTVGTWPGGRFELDAPADSTLLAYTGWGDALRFDAAPGDAERLESLREDVLNTLERLPDSLTGQPRLSVAFDRFTDIWRYNRAEGASLGAGYEWRPGLPFIALMVKGRYGFTDGRLQASLAVRRDAPGSRLEIAAFREMRDADPLAPGLTFSNSVDALWFARDDGDYVFLQGGEARYQRPLGVVADLTLRARYGEETAPIRLAHAGLNDLLGGSGDFRPNGPVRGGHYWVAAAELAGGARPFGWFAAAEGTAGARRYGRGWLGATGRTGLGTVLDVTVSGWLGLGGGDSLPQREFRLGGSRTLRGYAPGAFRGASAWAAGADIGLLRGALVPVVFVDAGQVAASGLSFTGAPLFSYGVGVSLLEGVMRLHAARPVEPHARWRLSFTVAARR